MGLRKPRLNTQIPEVNLVPMMDVLMTVLTFFIIISMILTGQQLTNVRLPQEVEGVDAETSVALSEVEALIVGLDRDGNLVINNEVVGFSKLTQEMQAYFADSPNGKVILKADRDLPYRAVATLLNDLRTIGGNRISLAVE